MNKKAITKLLISCIFTINIIFVFYPLVVKAALNQSSTLSTTIRVDVIDSIWCDKYENNLTSLSLPEFVAPGEKVLLNDAIYTKNTGVPAFARFKIQEKINNIESNCFDYVINTNWVKGNDDYYYYCNQSEQCIIPPNQLLIVIEELYIFVLNP